MDFSQLIVYDFFTWGRIIASCITVAGATALWIILRKICKSWTKKEAARGSNSLVAPVIWSIMRFVIIAVGIIILLGVYGINVTSAVAGLGIASAVIGLALQDILKDVIMGIHIATDKFFSVGDSVIYNGELGVVIDFNLKTTKIRTIDAPGTVSVCNRKIEEIKLAGESYLLDIPVPYETPVDRVEEIFKGAAKKTEEVPEIRGCSYAGIDSFGESAIMHRFFIRTDPLLRYGARRKALRIIKDELDAAGINIPFNQLDVHLDVEEVSEKKSE